MSQYTEYDEKTYMLGITEVLIEAEESAVLVAPEGGYIITVKFLEEKEGDNVD